MAEAWAATRGKRWRLLGMAFLLGLVVVLGLGVAAVILVIGVVVFDAPVGAAVLVGLGLAAILCVTLAWFWIRVRALAVPTLMLEPVGVFGALRRAVRLTHHQFWRLFGLLLLVSLVIGVAGGILRLPFSITGEVFLTSSGDTGYGLLLYLLLTAVGTVISSAVLQPFSAAVSALLYIDQRIRKEAYDVELLTRAGILPV
jgi:membrane-anchored glycerophosphoryl diester phosphodiesterase (GDPDase)